MEKLKMATLQTITSFDQLELGICTPKESEGKILELRTLKSKLMIMRE